MTEITPCAPRTWQNGSHFLERGTEKAWKNEFQFPRKKTIGADPKLSALQYVLTIWLICLPFRLASVKPPLEGEAGKAPEMEEGIVNSDADRDTSQVRLGFRV